MSDDIALEFYCQGEQLLGVLSPGKPGATRGVLIVVGGPQYRVGSHRQFTLLARSLGEQGIPVLRFDYRGMGDSHGAARDFECVQEDVRSAIDCFMKTAPGLREVVVWGLCDAASAALFYARGDARVCGLVLLNPWARSELGAARATLRHYYLQRLRSKELWQKIYRRDFDYRAAARSLRALLATLLRRSTLAPLQPAAARRSEAITPALHQRLLAGFAGFSGQVLLVISAKDLTAQEFLALAGSTRQWRRLMGSARVTRCTLPEADHTFSSYAWRNQVADCTVNWIRSW